MNDKGESSRRLRVFLCHSSGDKQAVRGLYVRLRTDGIDPWLDEVKLLPGQKWQEEISKSVRDSDVVIVCLSQGAINKSGYVQKEIKYALDVADEQAEGTIFLIPAKLERCETPHRLSEWQWVNLFEPDGYVRLMRALYVRARTLAISLPSSLHAKVDDTHYETIYFPEGLPPEALCPACGVSITFQSRSSLVVVCEFCHSVLAREDRKLENLGESPDIRETGSLLEIGSKGFYRRIPFRLIGRVQFEHDAGSMWDEWYATFADGRWGSVSEAQGRFYLTFESTGVEAGLSIPPFDMLQLGGSVPAPDLLGGLVQMCVVEKSTALSIAVAGEIPYYRVPGMEYQYADCSGSSGEFATIDYDEAQPRIRMGREVSLSELSLL